MLLKKRSKSTTHFILESLNYRMKLSFDDKRRYQNQIKGFEGECLFDQYINHPQQTGLIINDLLLSTKDTYYQMDSILILNQQIYLYEVKNFTGSYTFQKDGIYSESGHLIQNPLDQVNRKKAYLHNLLLNMGIEYPVTTYVAFVHPKFYLYSLPRTESILFHGQLTDHFMKLAGSNQSSVATDQNLKLAQSLVEKHHENYRPNQLPAYDFTGLKKGVLCPICFSFQCTNTRKNRICTACGFQEKIADAIYRSVLEWQMLFPEMPITTQNIFIWCGGIYLKDRIRYLLVKEFIQHSKGSKTFYTH